MSTVRKPLLVLVLWVSVVGGSFAQLSANFTNQIACDRSVTFTNNSTGFTTVSWDFGNGANSAAVSPVYQYPASGTFTVVLTTSNGTVSTSYSQNITLFDPPSQSITGDVDVCANGQETYSVSTSGNSYHWNVTGGVILSGQGTNTITVRWTQTGAGNVGLTERTAGGCSSVLNNAVQVHPAPNPVVNVQVDQGSTVNLNYTTCSNKTEVFKLRTYHAGSTYQWEVAGGTLVGSAQADSLTVFWGTVGNGLIKITETTAFGCSAQSQVSVQVVESPFANFRTFDICLGSTAYFTDLSTGNFTDWHWDFGDGTVSNDQHPSHLYTAAGTYYVTLTVVTTSDSSGGSPFYRITCPDDTTIAIRVDQNPGPQIVCPGTVCAGDVETYSTPAIAGATYTWTVAGGTVTSGGGTSDNEITVAWGNTSPGTLSLQVTGAGTYCNVATVIEIPIISPVTQISGPTTVCRFTDAVYQAPLLPGSVYTWTVTGGNIMDGQGTNRITTRFNSTGPATIALNVFHDLTECSGQNTLTVQVLNQFNLSAQSTACAQSNQTYSVSGTPNTSGYTWNWTITGGTITAGQGTNSITVTWGSSGTTGEVAVDAPAGIYCNAREQRPVSIRPLPPPAALSGAMNVCAASSNTYYVPAGYYTTWNITGGTVTNGGTNGSNYATVQWGSGPSGQITVTQEDRTIWPYCSTVSIFAVAISNNVPVTISGPAPVCAGYTATYSAGGNASLSYLWEVSGGNVIAGGGTNSATIQWGSGPWGTIQVTELSCNNTDNMVVEINRVNGAVIDTANLTCSGNSLTLYVPGAYSAFSWSTGAVDSFTNITTAGTYTVSLTDANGCTTQASTTIGTMPTLPVPFASITGAGPLYTPITFLELTAHPAGHRYQWSTGGTGQQLYVTTAGTYSVTVTNSYGCTSDAFVNVTNTPGGGLAGGGGNCPGGGTGGVCPATFPNFTTSICNPIQFTNTTNPPAMAYVWDFNDGTYAWTEHTAHVFGVGNHTVDLWASDNGSCWTRIQRVVNVTSYLDAQFTFTQACFGQPIQFTDASAHALPVTWQWNFGDAATASTQNPSHTYTAAGTYIVSLTIDDGVCTDVFYDTLIIRNLTADFTYQQACYGNPTLFTDISAGALEITRWNWNFGDGSNSTIQHPAHAYNATGIYNVLLTVTDRAGCTSTRNIALNVIQFTAGNITYSGPTTFCEGDSLVLNAPAGAGYTYQWSTGQTTAFVSAKQGGTYYVVVTDANGCKDTTNPVVINVYPAPQAFIIANGPLTFCEFGFTTLIANPAGPGFTYQWTRNGTPLATTQTTSVSSSGQSGTYLFIVTDNHGCKDTSGSAVVTVHPRPPFPSITANGPTTFCEGDSVRLTATAGYQYDWSTGAITRSITAFTNDNYGVTITDANGCTNSNSQFVMVNPLPDMSLVAYGCYDVCASDSNVIHGPPNMASYQWSNGQTTQSIIITTAGTYNLTATSYDGCTNSSRNLNISTTNFLGIDLGNDTSFCQGGTVTFDAGTGFTSYTWQNGSTAQTFTASATDTYFVEVVDTSGCVGADTVALTVFPNPVVTLDDTVVCTSSNITLDAGSGFATYLWSDNTSNQTLAVSASGTYSVTVTDVNTCSATDAADVLFSAATAGLNLGNDTSFCNGGTITFNASSGYVTYTWQDGSTTQTFVATATDTYYVSATDSNGCATADTVVLTVFQNPVVTLQQDTLVCDTASIILDAGNFATYLWSDNSTNQTLAVSSTGTFTVTVTDGNNCTASDDASITYAATSSSVDAFPPDTSVCAGVTVQLSVSGGVSYTWTADPTLTNTGGNNPTATPTASTTYFVSAIDSFGCARVDSVVISILPLLTAQATPTVPLCEGRDITITASGGTEYIWFPATGLSCSDCPNPVANPTQTTTYQVAVSQPGYCNSDTATVTVDVLPLPETGLDSVITIAYGEELTFQPNSGMLDYNWWSDGWACDGCPNPTVSPGENTLYTLEVIDSAGCQAFKEILVHVLDACEGNFYIPTAFSPNGDGNNDIFRIIHPGDLQLVDFKVFNRWGEIVFETADPDKGWDGIYKGVKQELAVFAYYAQLTCGTDVRTVTGNVTLVH